MDCWWHEYFTFFFSSTCFIVHVLVITSPFEWWKISAEVSSYCWFVVVMKIKTKLRKYWISCVLLNAWMPRVFSFSSIVMQCFLSLALLLDSFVLKTKSWSFCSSLLLMSLLTPTNFFIIVTCQYAPSNQCLFFFFFFIFHFSLTLIWCW